MMRSLRLLAGAIALLFPSLVVAQDPAAATPQDLPRFSSSVEVTSVDVSVLDGRGRPDPSLKAEDFVVKVDGSARKVISAEFVQLQLPDRPDLAPPPGYSSNEESSGGRLILIVVDQPNIRFGGTFGIRRAVNGFIDRLQPSDRAAVIGLGRGAPSTPFTNNREFLKKTIERLVGQYQPAGMMLHSIGLAEAMDISQGNQFILSNVIRRECVPPGPPPDPIELEACQFEIEAEARQLALNGAVDGRMTIDALRGLLTALRRVEGPKTMVFVSEGFMLDNMQGAVTELGTIAAAARASIYALKLDDSLFAVDASVQRAPISRMDDRQARAEGMNLLVGASRGTLFNVVGTGSNVFERIEAEMGGYYLIGVESGPEDKNGRAHPISVETTRRGVTVRARRALVAGAGDIREPRTPREAVLAALAAPLSLAGLPVRVATYSLQGPETAKVQVLLHADIGSDYSQSRPVAIGYVISNLEGQPIESQAMAMRLMPVMNGVPSALQFAGGASLPPGEYVLKMAIAEGDRVGSLEHHFTAGVTDAANGVRVSDLMIGGPVDYGEEILQPTVGYTVVFGAVHGYMEAYGPESGSLRAKYEVASEPEGPALLSAEASPRTAGRQRAIFSRLLPVRQLPQGKYYLRVTLSGGAAPIAASGAFEVGAPSVLMSSASPTGLSSPDVFLPVTESQLSHAFDPEAALAPATAQAFRTRVPEEQRAAFDQGVQSLRSADYADAEADFKKAMSLDGDSSSALAYMAATFAASGHDTEAISAWQTALVDGSDQPEIYEWLSEALMRSRDLALSRSVLEEAVAKWPSDIRFARPLALVYATFGQGREAMRALERHLAAAPADVEFLQLGVEWLYQLRTSNAFAHSAAEDLALARRYADAYRKNKGPQQPLVKQWLEFIEKKK